MADACPNCGVWLGNEPLPNDSAWARQQAEIERLRAEIERLRALGDALAIHLDAHYGLGNPHPSSIHHALAAWQEARRG